MKQKLRSLARTYQWSTKMKRFSTFMIITITLWIWSIYLSLPIWGTIEIFGLHCQRNLVGSIVLLYKAPFIQATNFFYEFRMLLKIKHTNVMRSAIWHYLYNLKNGYCGTCSPILFKNIFFTYLFQFCANITNRIF